MTDLSRIVVVKLSKTTPVKLPYTIYVNAPMDIVKGYAQDNPMVYVIVFYTLDYASTDNWDTTLGKKWATRVLSPIWIANTEEMELYTNHFLTLDGMTKDDWEAV